MRARPSPCAPAGDGIVSTFTCVSKARRGGPPASVHAATSLARPASADEPPQVHSRQSAGDAAQGAGEGVEVMRSWGRATVQPSAAASKTGQGSTSYKGITACVSKTLPIHTLAVAGTSARPTAPARGTGNPRGSACVRSYGIANCVSKSSRPGLAH